ncbi:MAG: hypothetical protein LUG83_08105, partial [Lachnospiraceae bacterium]|nr:hypothetical protein [Lachnospiraceae bacterium]
MVICMAIATFSFLFFTYLFMSADDSIIGALLVCCRETQAETIKNTQIEMKLLVEAMKKTGNLRDKKKVRQGKKLRKKLGEAQKQLDSLNKGRLGVFDLIPLAGYRLMQLMKWDATN